MPCAVRVPLPARRRQAETTRLLEAWLHTLGRKGGGFGACIDAGAAAQLGAAVGLGAEALDLTEPPVRGSERRDTLCVSVPAARAAAVIVSRCMLRM